MNIDHIRIQSPTALAPMEAVNSKAFRMLCKEMGAGLIYTALIDVEDFRPNLIDIDEMERPLVFQITGNDKKKIESTAKYLEDFADIIDINLGCPNKDILSKKCGAFFLKHPEQIEKKFGRMIKHSKVPVTAKIRLGWDKDDSSKISSLLENMGVKAIAIHARTLKQGYRGKADWEAIRKVKQSISIPVIGNGDIDKAGTAKYYLERGYCDMVMVGRKAKRYPGIFSEIDDAMNNRKVIKISKDKIKKRFLQLYTLQKKQKKSQIDDHLRWLS